MKSDVRKIILGQFEKLSNDYSELIKQTDDKEKKEELFDMYKRLSDIQSTLYLAALKSDNEGNGRPGRPDVLSGLKNFFKKIDIF